MKFKAGDIVKAISYTTCDNACEFIGKVGEIVKIGTSISPYRVHFKCRDSRGNNAWWFAEYDLEPVNDVAKQDVVNHPSHYIQGKVECIDAIESAVTGLKGFEAVCTGHIMRYIWRWKFKNGLQDLKKCRYYLDKLINKIESEGEK